MTKNNSKDEMRVPPSSTPTRRDFLHKTAAGMAAGTLAGAGALVPASSEAGSRKDRRDLDNALNKRHRSPHRRILIKGGTVISMDPNVGNFAKADILIEGTKIVSVRPDIRATATVIDASDMIVIPGFCDPHIHSWQGQLARIIPNQDQTESKPTRNYTAVMHNTFGPLYRPQDMYIGTLVTLLSALDGGITTVVDCSHNVRSRQHAEAAVAAHFDSGMRGTYAGGRPLFGTWDHQWPQDAYGIKKRHFSSDDQLQTLALYAGGSLPVDEFRSVLQIRKDLGVRMHIDSGLFTQPIKEYYDTGLFYGKETFNHGTALSAEQRKLLIDGGLKVNVCPRIETQFRAGHVPYNEWVEMGLRPGISNDDPATYSISMFDEMQTLYAFERAR
jgi:5-methylthioadenosine/S-adenosylhomocysteine deaminase